MVPYFLEKLKNTPDGDSNLLDNTLVIYGSPMGDSNVHNHKRCPLFLAGHAGGTLKGSLHLKAADGTPMANVMLTLLHDARPRRPAELRRQHRRARSEHERRRSRPTPRTKRLGRRRAQSAVRRTLTTATNADLDRRDGRAVPLDADCTPRRAGAAAFVDAAMNGDRDAVRALLKDGADVNAAQGDGMTALHWAAQKGDVELAQMLLYAGANVKATTRLGGYTPLLIASKNGDARDDRRRCSPAGADANAPTTQRHDAADAGRGGRQRRRP